MSVRRIKAFYTLATALLRHILARPFVTVRGGTPWMARLHEEQLGAVPQGAWQRLAGTSRCIGCGVCDLVDAGDTSVAALVMGAGRQPADAAVELHRAARLRQLAPEIAKVCPARVAAEDIAALIQTNAEMLTGHR